MSGNDKKYYFNIITDRFARETRKRLNLTHYVIRK